MKFEIRVFAKGKPEEKRHMLFLPEDEYEMQQFDFVFGAMVQAGGKIADVQGSVQLADGYGELYLRVERSREEALSQTIDEIIDERLEQRRLEWQRERNRPTGELTKPTPKKKSTQSEPGKSPKPKNTHMVRKNTHMGRSGT